MAKKLYEVDDAVAVAGHGESAFQDLAESYDRLGVPRVAGLDFERATVDAFVNNQVLAEFRLEGREVTIHLWPLQQGASRFADDTIPRGVTRLHQRSDLGDDIEIEYIESAIRPECLLAPAGEVDEAESLCITKRVKLAPSRAHVSILANYILKQVGALG